MKTNTFVLFFLALLITACSFSPHKELGQIESNDTIKITPNDATKAKFSLYFDSISYIPIQTNRDFLIGHIDKLLITKGPIFIMDSNISKSVFCLSNQGHILFKISHFGNGPGEYINLSDIAFDETSKELIIYCRIRKMKIHFNMHGDYLREVPIPYKAWRIQPVGDKLAVFCEYEDDDKLKASTGFSNLALLDIERKHIISTANVFEAPVPKNIVWTSQCQFSPINDTLYSIKPDHCNTVFHVTPTRICPAYTLDFGNKQMIDNRYWEKTKEKNISLDEVDAYCKKLKLCESFHYLESDDYVYFAYNQSGNVYYVIYSKNTGVMRQYVSLIDDMSAIAPFKPLTIKNNKAFCILDAGEVFHLKEVSMKHSVKISIPKKIMDNAHEFDNPIITVFTLKKF